MHNLSIGDSGRRGPPTGKSTTYGELAIVASSSRLLGETYAELLSIKYCFLPPSGILAGGRARAVAPSLIVVVDATPEATARCARDARLRWPTVALVIAGIPRGDYALLRCLDLEPRGVVFADEPADELRRTLALVATGERRLPPESFAAMFQILEEAGVGHPAPRSKHCLSTRELAIHELLSAGKSNKDIAAALGVEVQTVKNHVTTILRKLGVESRRDVSRAAPPPES